MTPAEPDTSQFEIPTLLIYGNCQAGALAVLLGADPAIALEFRVRYLPSFDDRVPGSKALPAEEVQAAALLLEQFDPQPFPYRDLLPRHCVTLTFPAVDLNLLWPLTCPNPLNDPPTEATPWGHFPYGDRVILDCVQRGLPIDETLAYYRDHSEDHLPNLERYEEIERSRLRVREAKCDVGMSDFVFSRLKHENLFWCVNHPTMSPLRELSHRLMDLARPRVPKLSSVEIDRTIEALPADGPLSFYRVPFHPAVVQHFELQWYIAEEGANYGLRATPVTYDEYLRGLTATAIESLKTVAAPARET